MAAHIPQTIKDRYEKLKKSINHYRHLYHVENKEKIDIVQVFKVMERRLLRAIMRPAAAVSIVAGALLIHLGGWDQAVPVSAVTQSR